MPDGHMLSFGPYQLDLSKEQFWCDGQPVRLPPKVFQVLRYLAERPGQLVTKEELFRVVWAETVVGDAALTRCIQEIRRALQDNAREPQYIETVHRRGFRFIAPLTPTPPVVSSQLSVISQAERVRSQQEGQQTETALETEKADKPFLNDDGLRNGDPSADEILPVPPLPKEETQTPPLAKGAARSAGRFATAETAGNLAETSPLAITVQPRRFRWWQVLVLIVVLVLGGVVAANWRLIRLVIASYVPPLVPEPIALPLPDKPSLVVLPFVNLSGDASQEYFSDGLTEDLIQSLSRIQNLFVIARQSAFTYKGKAVKIQDIGRELGMEYVLEGSVRKAANQVRVAVRLVEANTGTYRWEERYERPLTNIFALQDEIVQQIVTTLNLQLTVQEQGWTGRKRTTNVNA